MPANIIQSIFFPRPLPPDAGWLFNAIPAPPTLAQTMAGTVQTKNCFMLGAAPQLNFCFVQFVSDTSFVVQALLDVGAATIRTGQPAASFMPASAPSQDLYRAKWTPNNAAWIKNYTSGLTPAILGAATKQENWSFMVAATPTMDIRGQWLSDPIGPTRGAFAGFPKLVAQSDQKTSKFRSTDNPLLFSQLHLQTWGSSGWMSINIVPPPPPSPWTEPAQPAITTSVWTEPATSPTMSSTWTEPAQIAVTNTVWTEPAMTPTTP